MRFDLVTLFPEMFEAFLRYGVCGRSVHDGRVAVHFWNPRDFAPLPHRIVDDKPYGGGSGMVLKPEPLVAAMQAAQDANPTARRIYLTPRGRLLDDGMARELSAENGVILLCGRYRGIDERAVQIFNGEEVSVGDYVLSGGETAALAVMDAVLRHVPGILGNHDSAEEEAFADGLLDAPCYTRPPSFAGKDVPDVLRCGDHAAVADWRRRQAEKITAERRPDLFKRYRRPPNTEQ